MSWFLIVYLLVYGGGNFYIFWKLRQAVGAMGWWIILPVVFLVAMVAGPIVVRLIDRPPTYRLASALSLVVHVWMGLCLWLVCLLLLGDLWNLLTRFTAIWWAPATRALLLPKAHMITAAAITALLAVVSVAEAWNIRPRELVFKTAALSPGSKPITIVQLTDLHVGVYTGPGRLSRILQIARQAHPDVLVSTGDMVDSPSHAL